MNYGDMAVGAACVIAAIALVGIVSYESGMKAAKSQPVVIKCIQVAARKA